ncbi:hypothetical protein HEP74_04197 [Xanthomonas sp. SS]|nr:hypothetical protein HEP74_04197 [Xanthomonas sp. SS]
MRIDAAGGATVVRASNSGDSRIRTSSVAERLAETARGIAFDKSLSKAMMPKTR